MHAVAGVRGHCPSGSALVDIIRLDRGQLARLCGGVIGRRLQGEWEFQGSEVAGVLIENPQPKRDCIRRNIHILVHPEAANEHIPIGWRLEIVCGSKGGVRNNGAFVVESGHYEVQDSPLHIAVGS